MARGSSLGVRARRSSSASTAHVAGGRSGAVSPPAAVFLPTARSYDFAVPASRALDWDPHCRASTAFTNTLSLFFPAGEQFFIRSVQRCLRALPAPGLPVAEAAAVRAFVAQEALHSREHEAYNAALQHHYGGAALGVLDAVVGAVLAVFDAGPRALALAGTVGLEHLTAALGHTLLVEPDLYADAEPHYAALWLWHAYEETEHKAVAYDVFSAVYGKGRAAWALRCVAFIMALAIFGALFLPAYLAMLAGAGCLFDVAGWRALLTLHWAAGGKGVLRRILPLLLDFFRYDFHPWDHDNRALLKQPFSFLKLEQRARQAGKRA